MSDEYVKATVILTASTAAAIQVDVMSIDSPNRQLRWIPRSLIHGGDDLRLDSSKLLETITFRLRAWKAAEIGL